MIVIIIAAAGMRVHQVVGIGMLRELELLSVPGG